MLAVLSAHCRHWERATDQPHSSVSITRSPSTKTPPQNQTATRTISGSGSGSGVGVLLRSGGKCSAMSTAFLPTGDAQFGAGYGARTGKRNDAGGSPPTGKCSAQLSDVRACEEREEGEGRGRGALTRFWVTLRAVVVCEDEGDAFCVSGSAALEEPPPDVCAEHGHDVRVLCEPHDDLRTLPRVWRQRTARTTDAERTHARCSSSRSPPRPISCRTCTRPTRRASSRKPHRALCLSCARAMGLR